MEKASIKIQVEKIINRYINMDDDGYNYYGVYSENIILENGKLYELDEIIIELYNRDIDEIVAHVLSELNEVKF